MIMRPLVPRARLDGAAASQHRPRPALAKVSGAAVQRSPVAVPVEAAGERLGLGVVLHRLSLPWFTRGACAVLGRRGVIPREQAAQERRSDDDGENCADDRACARLRGLRRAIERIVVR